jgi:hypothetical protein
MLGVDGVGDRRSQAILARNFSLKTGKDKKKEKEHTRKKKIQTAELNRRDQVTAAKSWPSFLRKEGNRGR